MEFCYNEVLLYALMITQGLHSRVHVSYFIRITHLCLFLHVWSAKTQTPNLSPTADDAITQGCMWDLGSPLYICGWYNASHTVCIHAGMDWVLKPAVAKILKRPFCPFLSSFFFVSNRPWAAQNQAAHVAIAKTPQRPVRLCIHVHYNLYDFKLAAMSMRSRSHCACMPVHFLCACVYTVRDY